MVKEDDLALTALIRGGDSVSRDGIDVFINVGMYSPPVFGDSGARVAVAGTGRAAAAAKYAPWARWVLFSLFTLRVMQSFFLQSFGWWLKQN